MADLAVGAQLRPGSDHLIVGLDDGQAGDAAVESAPGLPGLFEHDTLGSAHQC
jgi:hypothetical protein